jgi:hypothetical protein
MKISKIALRGFRPTNQGIKQALGKLENAKLDERMPLTGFKVK